MVLSFYGYSEYLAPSVDGVRAELTATYNAYTAEELDTLSIHFDECRARGGEVVANPLVMTPIGLASTGYKCSKLITLEEYITARL